MTTSVTVPRAPLAEAGSAGDSTWRCPPRWVLLVAVLLIAVAEVGGAAMVRYRLEVTRWARGAMLARPDVHGLVGVRDVDEQLIDRALVTLDAGLRLFHLHAEGMGLVIIATAMVVATFVAAPPLRRALLVLLTVGGAGYPVGYLFWSGLIPYVGLDESRIAAEWLFWIPFGGASIVALWVLAGVLAVKTAGR